MRIPKKKKSKNVDNLALFLELFEYSGERTVDNIWALLSIFWLEKKAK